MGTDYNVCQIMVRVAEYSVTVIVMVMTRTLICCCFWSLYIQSFWVWKTFSFGLFSENLGFFRLSSRIWVGISFLLLLDVFSRINRKMISENNAWGYSISWHRYGFEIRDYDAAMLEKFCTKRGARSLFHEASTQTYLYNLILTVFA